MWLTLDNTEKAWQQQQGSCGSLNLPSIRFRKTTQWLHRELVFSHFIIIIGKQSSSLTKVGGRHSEMISSVQHGYSPIIERLNFKLHITAMWTTKEEKQEQTGDFFQVHCFFPPSPCIRFANLGCSFVDIFKSTNKNEATLLIQVC